TQAPAGTALPAGIDGAKQVTIADPTNPAASSGYVYIMRATATGPKPAFDASNGYVRYLRDPNADTYLFSQSQFDSYGNAPRGHFYWPGKGCVGGDPSKLGTAACPRDLIDPGQAGFFDCPQRHRP